MSRVFWNTCIVPYEGRCVSMQVCVQACKPQFSIITKLQSIFSRGLNEKRYVLWNPLWLSIQWYLWTKQHIEEQLGKNISDFRHYWCWSELVDKLCADCKLCLQRFMNWASYNCWPLSCSLHTQMRKADISTSQFIATEKSTGVRKKQKISDKHVFLCQVIKFRRTSLYSPCIKNLWTAHGKSAKIPQNYMYKHLHYDLGGRMCCHWHVYCSWKGQPTALVS